MRQPIATVIGPPAPAATDEALVRRAVECADPNILRLTLYQLTRDPVLARMRTEKLLIWAGALFTYVLAPEHHAEVRARAVEYLLGDARPQAVLTPSRHEVREVMELFGHGQLSDVEFDFAYEEAAWDEFPRDVQWPRQLSAKSLSNLKVLVIGAGISGIAAAVQLQRLNIPYQMIERQADLGGTWNLNTYPDVRVDSTSMIYQYKFEKKYPWTELFASGSETRKYLRHCAEKYGVLQHIEFNTEVIAAVWDERAAQWCVSARSADGSTTERRFNFIISASGLFSTPKLPDIAGIGSFSGEVVHTTGLKPDRDLRGRKIALIGTGATGVQLMPHLARVARRLTVFQRTPNWILPMEGYKARVPAELQWLFENLPLFWNWYCYGMYYLNAQLEGLQTMDPGWREAGGAISQRNDELRRTAEAFIRSKFAARPDLIAKVLPDYPPMARRPTIDNGWYDALLQDNVELVSGAIREIVPGGIVDRDGVLHECDLIVCAAGFATERYFWPVQYVGRAGMTLERLWGKDGPRAYLGLTMPGFPNLFTFFGPNSQGRSGSFYSVAEMWARYSLKAILHTVEGGHSSIECRPEAYAAYNRRIDDEARKLLWETYGKGFYYVTAEGRSVVNSPWGGPQYRALLHSPDFNDFEVR